VVLATTFSVVVAAMTRCAAAVATTYYAAVREKMCVAVERIFAGTKPSTARVL
jgi:hypothetical protein